MGQLKNVKKTHKYEQDKPISFLSRSPLQMLVVHQGARAAAPKKCVCHNGHGAKNKNFHCVAQSIFCGTALMRNFNAKWEPWWSHAHFQNLPAQPIAKRLFCGGHSAKKQYLPLHSSQICLCMALKGSLALEER